MSKKVRQTEIYRKSEEIFQTIRTITDLIPEDNVFLQETKRNMLENIMVIQAKLASGIPARLWDLKMENAAIIRKNARELMVMYHSLTAFGFEEAKYYLIVREQLEEFRLLFRDWVSTFNPKHFITDEWGLFYPPGIPQDYVQDDVQLNFLDEDDGEDWLDESDD